MINGIPIPKSLDNSEECCGKELSIKIIVFFCLKRCFDLRVALVSTASKSLSAISIRKQ